MSKINYRDPDSLLPTMRNVYFVLRDTFRNIGVVEGWELMQVNAFVVGMCRSSMEDLLGVEGAIKEDLAWRQDIGWTDETMWRPIAESNPPAHETVLFLCSNGDIYQGRGCYGMHAPWWCGHSTLNFGEILSDKGLTVTHWKPRDALEG